MTRLIWSRAAALAVSGVLAIAPLAPVAALPPAARLAQVSPWSTFTSPEGDFALDMPGTPVATEEPGDPNNYTGPQYTYSVELAEGEIGYVALVQDLLLPVDFGAELIDQLFAAMRAQMIEEGEVLAERPIQLGDRPGREFVAVDAAGTTYKARFYWAAPRFYGIVVGAAAGRELPPDTERFLDSFRLFAVADASSILPPEFIARANAIQASRQRGDFPAVRQQVQIALAEVRERRAAAPDNLQWQRLEGILLNDLGEAERNTGNFAAAETYLQQALDLRRAADTELGVARTLANLGNVAQGRGDYAAASQYYEQALPLLRAAASPLDEGTLLNNLGMVYTSLGDYARARNYYEQARSLYDQISDRDGEALVLGNLGLLSVELGQYPEGLDYSQRALAIARDLGQRSREGTLLNNIGEIYRLSGQADLAIASLEQALVIHREVGNQPLERTTLSNLGNLHYGFGRYETALEYQEQALALTRAMGDRSQESTVLNNIAQVYQALDRWAEAGEFLEAAIAVATAIGDRSGRGTALHNFGLLHLHQGNVSEAIASLQEAVAVWESLRADLSDTDKVSIFETQADSYELLQVAHLRNGHAEAALEVAERGRARAFVERFAQRLEGTAAIAPPSIEDIRRIAREQQATLVEYSVLDDAYIAVWVVAPSGEVNFRWIDLAQAGLDATDNAASLTRFTERALLSAARGGASAAATPPANSVETLVAATRSATGEARASEAALQPRLRHSYDLLVAPIADLLPDDPAARIVMIPHDTLFLMPFPALQAPDGEYLLEKHTLITAPAIQVLQLTRQQRLQLANNRNQQALVVGNPTMPSLGQPPRPLPALPGTEVEAREVAALLDAEPLLGAAATEEAVLARLPEARWIHLATHGLLSAAEGWDIPGAIALTPTATGDGLLTASELLDVRLNAELVVLSACDTGRGRITGDGVYGLSRSLLTAGAASAIVTLWHIPDEPTAALMATFYRYLDQGLDKAQALRQAMLAIAQEYPDPSYWAAFTLIGEAE